MNRVQVVLSGFREQSASCFVWISYCFVLSRQKLYVGMVVYISLFYSFLYVDVMVMPSA